MTKIKVQVTQEDIDQGKPRYAFGCPVHRALCRATGDTRWSVTPSWIRRERQGRNDNTSYFFYEPAEVFSFVDTFDNKGKEYVRPFEFSLELEDEPLT